MGFSVGTALCLLMAIMIGLTRAAAAQALADDGPNIGVMDRKRPAYDAKGIPLGGFRVFPRLDVDGAYDDNVFYLPAKVSDQYLHDVATARIVSQWGSHFLEAFAGFNNYTYQDHSALSLTDWNVGTDGRYDVERNSALSAGGTYGAYHELLSSPNTVGSQAAPNRYFRGHSEVTGTYGFNRLGFTAGLSLDRYNFQNAPLNGGGFLNNADRDEDQYQGYLRALYEFSPDYSTFLKVSYDGRHFDQFFDRNGFHRNSTGYRVDGGVKLQLTNLLRGEIFAGYLEQHFSRNQPKFLKNISGIDFGGTIDWFATPLLTVHLTGEHQVSDVVLAGVSASDDETVRLSADYEVSENLIAQGYVSYTHSHLEGIGRQDEYPAGSFGLKYYVNRYLSSDLTFRHSERSSNFPGTSFSDNVITAGVTAHI